MQAVITGVGSYLPERVMANSEFTEFLDTSDEWITSHTGIRFRRIARADQKASDLGFHAAVKALERSGVVATDLDMILVATATADYRGFPSTASIIQHRLGAHRAGAMDLAAACTGFVYGLETARAFVAGGSARRVLVVGTEVMSQVLDWSDRNTCVLFGDGAGAVVVSASSEASEASEGRRGILDSVLRSEGSGSHTLAIPVSNGNGKAYLTMAGQPVYNFAVRVVTQLITEMLDRTGIGIADLAAIVPHQANIRIIRAAARRLGVPDELFFTNIDAVANTSAASIPIALDAMVDSGRLAAGDLVLTVGFGGGLTYGANLIRW